MSNFQVGDKVKHINSQTIFEISYVNSQGIKLKGYEYQGYYVGTYYYKPSIQPNIKLFCKNLQVECTSLDYSYKTEIDGPEFIKVQYPDGSSCEASVESFELRQSKFKVGDNVQFTEVCGFDDNYDRIVTDIKYDRRLNRHEIYYNVMKNGKLLEKTYDYEYRLMLKPFKPTIKKGDIILFRNERAVPTIAHNDSFMADGQEWVSYGYKDVPVSLVNKYVLAAN